MSKNPIKLIEPYKIEKAKRRAQSMIFESFSGVNGVHYLNAIDHKLNTNILYIPEKDVAAQKAVEKYQSSNVVIKILPSSIRKDLRKLTFQQWLEYEHGALYLPYPYICSTSLETGRFGNEQYYWDSYLYVLSLLSFDQVEDAKGLVRNLCYQIDHYGMVLNANRTYYLGRSQPPLLSTMVMSIYTYLYDRHVIIQARDWIKECASYIEKEFKVWEKYAFKTFKYNGQTYQLATYFDVLNQIAPEALDESGYPECVLGGNVDEKVYKSFVKEHPDRLSDFILIKNKIYFTPNVKPHSKLQSVYKECLAVRELLIKDDNAQRASGFDPCHVTFENHCTDIVPICLNSLLSKTCDDLKTIYTILQDGSKISTWRYKRNQLNEAIDIYLWNADIGVYQNRYISDQEFTKAPFITMVYPLMFGLASADKAKSVATYIVDNFSTPYGLKNVKDPGSDQWDNIWGILNYFVNKGFRMYGNLRIDIDGHKENLEDIARRFSTLFLNNVIDVHSQTMTFYEKYNPRDGLPYLNYTHYGNQYEFSWTASALLTLLARL